MAQMHDILLTVDFDRTLTATDGTIPERNLEAIRYFMENGGSFTVNTGRSTTTFRRYLNTLPVNAPLLMYNGSAAYENGQLTQVRPIDLDMWETLDWVQQEFPDVNLEIQAVDTHYLVTPRPEFLALYEALGWEYKLAEHGKQYGPFIKFALFGKPKKPNVDNFFHGSEEEVRYFDMVENRLRQHFADKISVFRTCARGMDIHTNGVSKLLAARDLQTKLGKKILVCVGDAENDITMLDGADFAYCPADGVVANRYETVCNCADGAVADVIYKKIPEILKGEP